MPAHKVLHRPRNSDSSSASSTEVVRIHLFVFQHSFACLGLDYSLFCHFSFHYLHRGLEEFYTINCSHRRSELFGKKNFT